MMIERDSEPSVVRQCKLLDLNRSSVYRQRKDKPPREIDQELMQQIDKIHLAIPFYGSRRIRNELRDLGYKINRKAVQRLMRKMRIRAVYPRPRTTVPNKAHRIYPYLLRDIEVTRPNQAWCTDITYIPMAQGFLYLVVIMDWYSRKALSWRLSNSMEADFCVEALQEALDRYGPPEIFNTDQGSQFTSDDFTKALKDTEVKISMDGKGRWIDNVFIERLWRSLKYEEVYLKAYESPSDARSNIGNWLEFYNERRRHQGLGDLTPDEMYGDQPRLDQVA